MTQITQSELEKKLNEFRNSTLKPGDWINAEILLSHVENLTETDLALAVRVLQRVKVLKPDSVEVKSKMRKLNQKLNAAKPDSMVSSSTEKQTAVLSLDPEESIDDKQESFNKKSVLSWLMKPFSLVVLLPFLIFVFYQLVWASDRFESHTQLIVKQPNGMSTLEPSMALLSGFTGMGGSKDAELVKAFIASNDLLIYLENQLGIYEHFSDTSYDYFSRLPTSATAEEKLAFYLDHVSTDIDEASGVISVKAQAFTPEFAKSMTELIVKRSEWYINKIGHDLAKSQLSFVENEHARVTEKLQSAKLALLAFQRQHKLLDPEAEGLALQQITYALEGQIASKMAELRALRSSMSDGAPLVMQANEQLLSLRKQLELERQRLTKVSDKHKGAVSSSSKGEDNLGVNEILTRYSAYKLDLEFALQAYSASLISLEKSRIEAYRQLKFLVVVESPTLAEDAQYPDALYNSVLFLVIILMIFGIGKIIFATARELG